jgi:hypothetical protein
MSQSIENAGAGAGADNYINFEALRYLITDENKIISPIIRSFFQNYYDDQDSTLTIEVLEAIYNLASSQTANTSHPPTQPRQQSQHDSTQDMEFLSRSSPRPNNLGGFPTANLEQNQLAYQNKIGEMKTVSNSQKLKIQEVNQYILGKMPNSAPPNGIRANGERMHQESNQPNQNNGQLNNAKPSQYFPLRKDNYVPASMKSGINNSRQDLGQKSHDSGLNTEDRDMRQLYLGLNKKQETSGKAMKFFDKTTEENKKGDVFGFEILHEVNLCSECNTPLDQSAANNSLMCSRCQQKQESSSAYSQDTNSRSYWGDLQSSQRSIRRSKNSRYAPQQPQLSPELHLQPSLQHNNMEIEDPDAELADILDPSEMKKHLHIGHDHQAHIPDYGLNARMIPFRKHPHLMWDPTKLDYAAFQKCLSQLNSKFMLDLTHEQVSVILSKYNYSVEDVLRSCTREKIKELAEYKRRGKSGKKFSLNRFHSLH